MLLLQALQLQEGAQLTCSSGYCIPQQRPELLSVCAAGTSRAAFGPALAPVSQAGRRLLVAVSHAPAWPGP